MKRFFILCAALLLLSGGEVYAQQMKWKLLAPRILKQGFLDPNGVFEFGAIDVKGKTILAGWTNVVLSTDEGATWTNLINAPVTAPDYVYDVDIYDENTFALITNESGAFLTSNKGVSWTKLMDVFPSAHAIEFDGAPDRIAMIISDVDYVILNLNGPTFSGQIAGTSVLSDIQIDANGALRIIGYYSDATGLHACFATSPDHGASWTLNKTTLPCDNYTFITDPSDANLMTVINEDWAVLQNLFSEIYQTTDNGFSWQKNFIAPISLDDYHLSGNSAKGCQDYFAGTVVEGVLRSTDKGQTWKSIGGPPSALDSRLLTALDDSLVYIVDTTGSIWVTDTKGRSSQPIISGDLQLRSTEFPPCDTSAEIFVQLSQNVCTSTNITSTTIIGANASDYTITKLPSSPLALPDSIGVAFTPKTPGDIDATLVMTFSDGSTYTVDLGTKVKTPPTLSFADLEFTTITTDTIGGDAVLHILSQGTGISADAEFTIHYDTTYLIYRGVFDSTGRDLTIGHPTPTSARVRMNNLTDSSLFALFSIFPVDSACTRVYIDSITEAPGKTKCLSIVTTPVAATICFDPADICGRQTLSKFVKNGAFPSLFVKPNPSSGNVTISSDREIHNAVVDIIDMYGVTRESISLEKLSNTGYVLSSTHLPNGGYEARVTADGYVGTLRFVIVK
jgi:photosystem II stability/assembly factor-like uncharacterized protein